MIKRILLTLGLACVVATSMAAGSDDVVALYASRGLIVTIAVVFGAGVLVSLTPCVYPMIPITLSIIGARSAGQKPIIGFLRSAVFVLGIAVIYSALGFLVANTDRTVGFLLQNKWFVITLALFFIAMGLSMMDFFTIQMPAGLAGKLQGGANRGGYVGAFLLGLVTGIAASPCGSPVLASILVMAAKSGNPPLGFALLFTYAVGMGLLFLVLGTFPAFLKGLPKSGVWMEDVKKFMGAVLIGVAIYYLRTVIPKEVYWPMVVLLCLAAAIIVAVKAGGRKEFPKLLFAWRVAGALLIGYAMFIAFVKVPPAIAGERQRFKPEEIVQEARAVLATGDFTPSTEATAPGPAADPGTTTGGSATIGRPGETATAQVVTDEWLTDADSALTAARNAGRPAIIDFGAEWCAACKELEHKTFPKPEVATAMKNFIKIRIDCTEDTDENTALRKRYGVKSLPSVIFINKDGKVQDELTLKTFESPEEFLDRLKKVQQ